MVCEWIFGIPLGFSSLDFLILDMSPELIPLGVDRFTQKLVLPMMSSHAMLVPYFFTQTRFKYWVLDICQVIWKPYLKVLLLLLIWLRLACRAWDAESKLSLPNMISKSFFLFVLRCTCYKLLRMGSYFSRELVFHFYFCIHIIYFFYFLLFSMWFSLLISAFFIMVFISSF